MKETGGHGVKLEGGKEIGESVIRIRTPKYSGDGHLGLTPQSIYKFGTYTVWAKEEEEAERLLHANTWESIGCFASAASKKFRAAGQKSQREHFHSGYWYRGGSCGRAGTGKHTICWVLRMNSNRAFLCAAT